MHDVADPYKAAIGRKRPIIRFVINPCDRLGDTIVDHMIAILRMDQAGERRHASRQIKRSPQLKDLPRLLGK